jgi:hypothetical protein
MTGEPSLRAFSNSEGHNEKTKTNAEAKKANHIVTAQ